MTPTVHRVLLLLAVVLFVLAGLAGFGWIVTTPHVLGFVGFGLAALAASFLT